MRVYGSEENKPVPRHLNEVKDAPECSNICMNFPNISAYSMLIHSIHKHRHMYLPPRHRQHHRPCQYQQVSQLL